MLENRDSLFGFYLILPLLCLASSAGAGAKRHLASQDTWFLPCCEIFADFHQGDTLELYFSANIILPPNGKVTRERNLLTNSRMKPISGIYLKNVFKATVKSMEGKILVINTSNCIHIRFLKVSYHILKLFK